MSESVAPWRELASQRFDVFLLYNSRDRASVERIAQRLKRAGLEPWLDCWSLTPGGEWQRELGAGLDASVACAVFVGADDLGAWESQEVAVAIDRAARQRGFRVFPVLLPGVQEPFDPNRLPHFLRTRTWVDFRRGRDDGRALQDLINAVKGVPFGPNIPVVHSDHVAPYRGLRVFNEEDAPFFFGRDRELQRLLEKLKSSRFVAVLGPSGGGKSSLVRAGLVPKLLDGALADIEDWQVLVMRPGASPLTTLAAQLTKLRPGQAMRGTLDELADDAATLHLSVEQALADDAGNGRYLGVQTYRNRFGDWPRAMIAATLPYDGRCEPRTTLTEWESGQPFELLRQAAAEFGGDRLRRAQYVAWRERQLAENRACGVHLPIATAATFCYRYGSWTRALGAAGLITQEAVANLRLGAGRAFSDTELDAAISRFAAESVAGLGRGDYTTWRADVMRRELATHLPSQTLLHRRWAAGRASRTSSTSAASPPNATTHERAAISSSARDRHAGAGAHRRDLQPAQSTARGRSRDRRCARAIAAPPGRHRGADRRARLRPVDRGVRARAIGSRGMAAPKHARSCLRELARSGAGRGQDDKRTVAAPRAATPLDAQAHPRGLRPRGSALRAGAGGLAGER